MLKCSNCGHETLTEAKFCGECGFKLERLCSSCGTVNPPANKFCLQCGQSMITPSTPETGTRGTRPPDGGIAGTRVTRPSKEKTPESRFEPPSNYTPHHLAEKILAARPMMERERKQVTVLFVDVSGYTSISEKLDPEAVHQLMAPFFDMIFEAIHRYEGTINQFLGDGVMALFGAPIAHEDHARRAVHAALDIQQALAVYQQDVKQRQDIEFRVRVGMNTGLVVVGTISDNLRMEYTAQGDTVNLASRMLTVAEAGQVVATEDTCRLIGDYFVTRSLGEQTVKGKAQPVRAYQIVRALEFRGRIEAGLGRGLTPYVGREKELSLLQERFADATDGRGQIVFHMGEPGVGKSRLLYEFRRSLEGRGFSWLTGRCISFGSQIAYLPLTDIVKQYFQVEETDDEADVIGKIDRSGLEFGEELRSSLAFLKCLLSVNPGDDGVTKMDPQIRRLRTSEALRGFLLRLSQVKPLVLVVEDLHWMDKASEDTLLYLADSFAAARVLLVLTYRPGYQNPFGERTYTTRRTLDRLSNQESVRLAEGMLAATDFPADLRALITQKAEGNPFFVEELIKSLLELGVLRRQDDNYVTTQLISKVHVPDTVQGVIMGRIDRLEDSPKRALQLASVIGREFTVRLLERISDLKGQLGSLLQDLKVLELIYERSLFPELAYMFKHALTQDVAYNSLLIQRRKALHRLVAMAIEELYPERLAEYYEMLAHHYEQAEVWDKALEYLVKAGEKSQQAYASQAALAHFDRALAVCERLELPVQPTTLMTISAGKGLAHMLMSEFKAAAQTYQRLLEVAQAERSQAREIEALDRAGKSFFFAHDFEKALEFAQRAKTLAVETGDKSLLAVGDGLVASVEFVTGKVNEGIARWQEILLESRESGSHLNEGSALNWLGLGHNFQGRYELAVQLLGQGMILAKNHNLIINLMQASWYLALSQGGKGDYTQALASLAGCLGWSDRFGDQFFKCRALNTLGWICTELYNLDPAIRHNLAGLVTAQQVGDPEIIRNAEINLGDCYLLQGDLDRAQSILEKVYADSLQRGKWGEEWMKWRYLQHCCHSLGELRLMRGDARSAMALAEECLRLAEPSETRKNLVKGWRLKGQALLALEMVSEAEEAIGEAIRLAREIGNPPQLWKTHEALGRLHELKMDAPQARSAYASAVQVIEETAGRLQDPAIKQTFLLAPQVGHIRARLIFLQSAIETGNR